MMESDMDVRDSVPIWPHDQPKTFFLPGRYTEACGTAKVEHYIEKENVFFEPNFVQKSFRTKYVNNFELSLYFGRLVLSKGCRTSE